MIWASTFLVCSCGPKQDTKNLDPIVGLWKIQLELTEEQKSIPFFLEVIQKDGFLEAAVWNGDERLIHEEVIRRNDTIIIPSPYFNSELRLVQNENRVEGEWEDFSRGGYTIPVTGKYNLSQRFKFNGPLVPKADGKWEVRFSPNTEDEYRAIGLFDTDEYSMKGTFITETGDYRFLDGGFGGDQLKLSTFDGSHAFLFEADYVSDTLRGWFWSGKHWKEPFIAWRNDSMTLTDPYTMTALTNAENPIAVSFPNLDGQTITLDDSMYEGKPVLLQIMGSWCPNCMDEAAFLADNQQFIDSLGVKVIGLSFERLAYAQAKEPLRKLKRNLNLMYPILYAGKANKSEAAKSVPWLDGIKSYPTLVYVLPNRKVFRIHTGFYGPGTGIYYRKQSVEMLDDIRKLAELSTAQP